MHDYDSRTALIDALAGVIAQQLAEAIRSHGAASFAVLGGSTLGPIFDALSDVDLDWGKVTVMPGDDRWVDEGSEHSNGAQIKARLLQNKAAKAAFLPFYTGGDGAEAVAGLTKSLAPHLPISVVLLGMGGDMHTASLFPGDAILAGNETGSVHYVPVPGMNPVVPRMTLTPHAINTARARHLVLFGADKLAGYNAAQDLNDPVKAPITSIKDITVHWAE